MLFKRFFLLKFSVWTLKFNTCPIQNWFLWDRLDATIFRLSKPNPTTYYIINNWNFIIYFSIFLWHFTLSTPVQLAVLQRLTFFIPPYSPFLSSHSTSTQHFLPCSPASSHLFAFQFPLLILLLFSPHLKGRWQKSKEREPPKMETRTLNKHVQKRCELLPVDGWTNSRMCLAGWGSRVGERVIRKINILTG